MATVSGKKGKKVKKTNKLSLGEFLTDGNTAVLNQVQISVPVKLSDWGEDGEDDDDDRGVRTQVIALPTAPRATRILNDDSIPQHPPFSIYVSNLPYDINEEDLYEIFADQEIVAMSLPRDDGDSRRLRGFGNIEFATRDDLIEVLAMPEPMVRNRRIRIGPYNENDTKRRNNRYDNFSSSDRDGDRPSSGNWRDRPDRGSGGGGDRDGGGMRRSGYNSGGGGGGYNRDREDRSGDSSGGGGNWRTDNRPPLPPPLSPGANRRNYDRDRGSGDGGFRRQPESRMTRPREPEVPMERPKLVLQPRTLPLPELPKPRPESDDDSKSEAGSGDGSGDSMPSPPRPRPTPVPAAKVFGDAKPVDTAAREREIEERLREKERLEREERQRKKEAEALAAAAARESEDAAKAGVEGADKENIDTDKENNASKHKGDDAAEEVVNWRVRKPDDETNKGNKAPHAHADVDKRLPQLPAAKSSNTSGGKYLSNRRTEDRRTDNQQNNRGTNPPVQRNGVPTGRDYPRDRDTRDRAPLPPPSRDGVRAGDNKDRPAKPSQEKDPKLLEERMPKFQEPTGPNLSMKNTFDGLSADEIDD
ncbi:eukaryotic translation initiation factor 4B-like [Anopheles ziemanni]|uniref:eukaryotic translation initiation factor 4B-like n=1 Tax=Anopheles ziemanni TaxID=345580 RepID=UPI00265F9EEA|nr:eukaryotic translation initiation factor 4B-like [Anopheles ziemanni]